MQHPEEGLIHAWLDGALPAPEATELESHVAACADCQARVAEARGLVAASSRIIGHLDAVPGNVIPAATPKRRLRSWRSPWVAALAAGLILVVRWNWPGEEGVTELPPPPSSVEAILPQVNQSMPVAAPAIRVEPQQAKGPLADSNRSRGAADAVVSTDLSSTALPPANAAVQKSTAAAEQPKVAPIPTPTSPAQKVAETVRREDQESSQRATANIGRRASLPVAAGAGGVASASAPPTVVEATASGFSSVAPLRAFAGCYEMNASTDILPARFALFADSSAIAGLNRISYVDADGRPTSSIADLGWTIEGGQVVVKTQDRVTLLTLRKTGSTVAGESRSGSRNGRVVSCR